MGTSIQKGPTLGLRLCCCHLESLDTFQTRSCTFFFFFLHWVPNSIAHPGRGALRVQLGISITWRFPDLMKGFRNGNQHKPHPCAHTRAPSARLPTYIHNHTAVFMGVHWGPPTFTHTHTCSHMNIRVTPSHMFSALEGAQETSKCHSSSPRPLRKQ